MIYIETEPSPAPLKSFVLRLGVFHIHYSFLDFIGYLIMVSDHQKVFDLADTENIVKHMLSDPGMVSTIHAHYLVVAALNTALLSDVIFLTLPDKPIKPSCRRHKFTQNNDLVEAHR